MSQPSEKANTGRDVIISMCTLPLTKTFQYLVWNFQAQEIVFIVCYLVPNVSLLIGNGVCCVAWH